MTDERHPDTPDDVTGAAGSGDDLGEGLAVDDSIREELGRVNDEMARLQELYLRKLADFENYRKRQEREMTEFRQFASADILRDCLPVLDNLERAVAAPSGGEDSVRAGVDLVLRQFRDVLARHGLEEVDPEGEAFDPALHEAIQRRESPDVEDNIVVEVFQKGYVLNGRLLRPAMVVVAVPGDMGATLPGHSGEQ